MYSFVSRIYLYTPLLYSARSTFNVQRIERTRKQNSIEFTTRNLGEFQLDVRKDRNPWISVLGA